MYNETHEIREVIFGNGREKSLKPEPRAVMSDATAYMVTDMLRTVIQSGSGTSANISGLPVVGKTGTTDAYVDSWFAGYTTEYTISIWTGYEDSTRSIPSGYMNISIQLFSLLISDMSATFESDYFVLT